jgi:hypothetical protein
MFRWNIWIRPLKLGTGIINITPSIRSLGKNLRKEDTFMAEKINIDVLTLDSVQCAACGYMMESIAALPSDVQDMIEYTEWSIKNKDGIGKFMELKGKVLPTICIERDLVFESIIPQYEELIDEMGARAPTDAMKERILALRDHGFEFDKIQENLARAGAGMHTRTDSKIS